MRSSWLYLATRSERAGAPVLIWPQLVATARSATKVSSVSPERCEITERYEARVAAAIVSRVSVKVPIWLTFTKMALATPASMPALEPLGARDEDVVADDLDAVAERGGVRHPSLPVLLGHAVLDRDDRVAVDELGPVRDELAGRERPALARRARSAPSCHSSLDAGSRASATSSPGTRPAASIASTSIRERVLVRLEVGGEAALVADGARQPPAAQHLVQGVVGLGAPLQAPRRTRRRRPGTIMNSWKSTLLSECTPPFSTFIIGTGSTWASTPPR